MPSCLDYYHLFHSLQNHLNGKTFDSNEAVKNEFVICINKLALKIMKKNEMTLLPTQYVEFTAFT